MPSAVRKDDGKDQCQKSDRRTEGTLVILYDLYLFNMILY